MESYSHGALELMEKILVLFMNETTLDIKCLISNSTILDKNELSLKRETMSAVYVSSLVVSYLNNELFIHCCSYIHGNVTLLVKSRLEISEEQSQF